jgi:hypothetical protein
MVLEACTCNPKPCTSNLENLPGAVLRDDVVAGEGRYHCVVINEGTQDEVIYRQVMVTEENGYSDPVPDRFTLSSDGTADFDGVPAKDANGSATHTVTCDKVDDSGTIDTSFNGTARILITASLSLSANQFNFSSGTSSITVGPSSNIVDFKLTAIDEAASIDSGEISLRFK